MLGARVDAGALIESKIGRDRLFISTELLEVPARRSLVHRPAGYHLNGLMAFNPKEGRPE